MKEIKERLDYFVKQAKQYVERETEKSTSSIAMRLGC